MLLKTSNSYSNKAIEMPEATHHYYIKNNNNNLKKKKYYPAIHISIE